MALPLFESGAIIKYLAEKNNSPLYPRSIEKRATVNQWIDFVSIHIREAATRVFWNRIGVKFMGQEADLNSLEEGLKSLDRFLPVLDNQLGKCTYLAGDELTLADFSFLAELDGAEMFGLDLSSYAHITAWRQTLQSQDFYQVGRSRGRKLVEDRLAENAA